MSEKSYRYLYWPIGFGYVRDSASILKWIQRAIESLFWTLDHPHRYRCQAALDVHKRARLRPWHGWHVRYENGVEVFGRTLHIGRFKVYFGPRGQQ